MKGRKKTLHMDNAAGEGGRADGMRQDAGYYMLDAGCPVVAGLVFPIPNIFFRYHNVIEDEGIGRQIVTLRLRN